MCADSSRQGQWRARTFGQNHAMGQPQGWTRPVTTTILILRCHCVSAPCSHAFIGTADDNQFAVDLDDDSPSLVPFFTLVAENSSASGTRTCMALTAVVKMAASLSLLTTALTHCSRPRVTQRVIILLDSASTSRRMTSLHKASELHFPNQSIRSC